jgi:hypothetical protein
MFQRGVRKARFAVAVTGYARDQVDSVVGKYERRRSELAAQQLQIGTSLDAREVAANGGGANYRAWRAHERAHRQSIRPKPRKLACPKLAGEGPSLEPFS